MSTMTQAASISHEGYRYHYRRLAGAGGGLPTVFLGGAFQSMRALQWFAEALLHRGDAILVDVPGSGDSDLPPAEVGADLLADCVVRVLNREGVLRANVVGVSFGTAIAFRLAQDHPERVASLVLIGTMSHVDRPMRAGLERSLDALSGGERRHFATEVSAVLLNHREARCIDQFALAEKLLGRSIDRMTPRQIEQFQVNGRRLLHHGRLDMFRPPSARTLVFTGEFDPLTTPEQCRHVASCLPDAHFTSVDRADHLAPLERPRVCIDLVDAFLGADPIETVEGCGSVERFRAADPERQRASG